MEKKKEEGFQKIGVDLLYHWVKISRWEKFCPGLLHASSMLFTRAFSSKRRRLSLEVMVSIMILETCPQTVESSGAPDGPVARDKGVTDAWISVRATPWGNQPQTDGHTTESTFSGVGERGNSSKKRGELHPTYTPSLHVLINSAMPWRTPQAKKWHKLLHILVDYETPWGT